MKKIFLLLIILISVAQARADYVISQYTIDGGGGTMTGGKYALTGGIGQPDAGYMYGDAYELLSGFWVGGPLCIVNMEDFAAFAAHWLDSPCDASNNWCGGADLDHLDDVDVNDFLTLANTWLTLCPYQWPLK